MDYGEVLSRAWQIIWKHKVLWIFGILAGCSSSGNSGNVSYSFSGDNAPRWAQDLSMQFNRIPDWQIAVWVGIAILVILVLVVLAIFLSTVGRIGVIQGVKRSEQGTDGMSFGELFRSSLPYFWRVFLLNLLVGVGYAVVIFVLVITFTLGAVVTLGLALICLIPFICLLIPISWLLFVFLEMSNAAIVVDDLGIMDGLQRGWRVFTNHIGPMIVMGLILFVGVSLIGGLIIGAPMFLIAIPALGGLFLGGENAMWGGLLVAGLCFVIYLPVLIVLNGILTSYVKSAWALTYMRLSGRPAAVVAVVEAQGA
jgi:hypothetical protein